MYKLLGLVVEHLQFYDGHVNRKLCYSTVIKMQNTFILPLLIIIASLLPSTFCSVDDDSTDALKKSNLIVATYKVKQNPFNYSYFNLDISHGYFNRRLETMKKKNPLGKFPKTRDTQAGLYEVECLDLLKDAFHFT